MKATELMIGDIIRYDDEIIRVKDIYHYGGKGYCINEDNYDIRFAEPIQLTGDILKENGFRELGHGEYILDERFVFEVRVYIRDSGNAFKIYNGNLGKIGCNNCHICYKDSVHELQQALRLCGLVELADNFEI